MNFETKDLASKKRAVIILIAVGVISTTLIAYRYQFSSNETRGGIHLNWNLHVVSTQVSDLVSKYVIQTVVNSSQKNRMILISSSGSNELSSGIKRLNEALQQVREDLLDSISKNKTVVWRGSGQDGHSRTMWKVLVDSYLSQTINHHMNMCNDALKDMRSVSLEFQDNQVKTSSLFGQSVDVFYPVSMDCQTCQQYQDRCHLKTCSNHTNTNYPAHVLDHIIKEAMIPKYRNLSTYWNQGSIHVFVIPGGTVVGETGGVFTRSHFLLSNQCSLGRHGSTVQDTISATTLSSKRTFKEVFVISQYWGEGFFHTFIENMPRLALYTDFLLANPNIRIHVRSAPKITDLIRLYQLDPARIITGNIQANIIYLPQGGSCTVNQCAICVRIMADLFAKVLPQTFQLNHNQIDLRRSVKLKNSGELTADYIVLLRRTRRRYLSQHSEIETILKLIARDFNLTYVLYPDDPVPNTTTTLTIFRRALLVVAPHGAGLSNLIFAPKGAFVVEVFRKGEEVQCYTGLSHDLGQRWHGILSSTTGPDMTINLKQFTQVVRLLLENRVS